MGLAEAIRSLRKREPAQSTAELKRVQRRVKALERRCRSLEAAQRATEKDRALLAERLAAATGRPLTGRMLIYGLPGSGNVIVQHIAREILGRETDLPKLSRSCISDHMEVVEAFGALADVLGGTTRLGPGYGRPWRLNGMVADGTDAIIFPTIPSPGTLGLPVYGSHNLPLSSDIDAYSAAGGHVAVVLRHPLDMIASCVGKAVPHGSPDRMAERDDLLTNMNLIAQLAWQVEAWWRRFAEIRDKVIVLRYEDALANPEAFVRGLATTVERDVDPPTVEALASMVGTADLSVPGHRLTARAGVGVSTIPEEAQAFFGGIKDIASDHGYEWPVNGARAPVLSIDFATAGYCFDSPTVRARLEADDMLHEAQGLAFVCSPDSKWRGRMRAPDVAAVCKALTVHKQPPIRWPD